MQQPKTTDNLKYARDKPSDCTYCYFWKANKKCCSQKECYYLLRDQITKSGILQTARTPGPEETGNCKTCVYGRNSPCIGYCIKKLLLEMKREKSSRLKTQNAVPAENDQACQG